MEKLYDGKGWHTGAFSVGRAPTHSALVATSWLDKKGVHIRVYYAAGGDILLEKAYDGLCWCDGGFKQASIPGSEVAVIHWGTGDELNLRVYYENGTNVTGVSEGVWNGNWVLGVSAIPPV